MKFPLFRLTSSFLLSLRNLCMKRHSLSLVRSDKTKLERLCRGDDVYVIMELCERDLKNFLCKNRDILMREYTKKEEEMGEKQPKDYYLIPADNMLKVEEDDKVRTVFFKSKIPYIFA